MSHNITGFQIEKNVHDVSIRQGQCIHSYFKSKNSFKAFSIEKRSLWERVPNFLMTRDFSIVDMAVLIADGFNKPASCQFVIRHSPMPMVLPVWLVTAIITTSWEILLYVFELMITAGRFLTAA